MKYHIEQAIQRSFNINKQLTESDPYCKGPGYEISGLAVASQEAQQLNDVLFDRGVRTGYYYFSPHGKWSVINFNKIKIKWANRCQQIQNDDGIWTILEGEWKDGNFLPYIESDRVKVVIRPLHRQQSEGRVLVPFQSFHHITDISGQVPQVRFEKNTLECVSPKSIAVISVNRQGVYINRKYREKMELSTEPIQKSDQFLSHYQLEIYLDGQLLDSYTLNYLS